MKQEKVETIIARVPLQIKEKIKKMSLKHDCSEAQIIRMALKKFLANVARN